MFKKLLATIWLPVAGNQGPETWYDNYSCFPNLTLFFEQQEKTGLLLSPVFFFLENKKACPALGQAYLIVAIQ